MFIYFLLSLLSGLLALLFSFSLLLLRKEKDTGIKLALIFSFTLIVVADAVSAYLYNTGFPSRDLWIFELPDIAIPFLIITLPLFSHSLVAFSREKLFNLIFMIGGTVAFILEMISELVLREQQDSTLFLLNGILLIITIIYSSIVLLVCRKKLKENNPTAIVFGVLGLLLLPGFAFVDIFHSERWSFISGMPIKILFVPGFYLIINLFFIIQDFKSLLGGKRTVWQTLSIHESCREYHLSAREMDVIELLIKGLSYEEISQSLYISKATVKTHINNIYAKCGVSTKIELINKLILTK